MDFKKRILVTSALPYANGPIHVGHLVEYIQTDIFVRFLKLIGKDAIYCCADDTHGTPIQIKAEQLGIPPEQLIAQTYKEHIEDFKSFHIEFDSYYSTNSPENKKYADQIFLSLKEKGLIYTKEVENFYDPKAKRFLPDRYVKGQCPKCQSPDQYGDVCEKCNATYKPTDLIKPYSTLTRETPFLKKSDHYFFKLSNLKSELEHWLHSASQLQPEIINYIDEWIKQGLQDWDISRDGPYFGFKIPGEADKYYYVWLDAPIGYIASTEHYCNRKGLDAESDYWKSKDASIIQFIGKDIIYFHFLFWPAMLLASGFKTPDHIIVHGFLTVNGEKMSKSRGTFITAKEFLLSHNPEYLRFYYAKSLGTKLQDINLDFKELQDSVNNELVANIGNFCYRVLSFLEKNFEGAFDGVEENSEFFESILSLSSQVKQNYEDLNFRKVVQGILEISSLGNKHFQEAEPWKKIKENPEEVRLLLGSCVNIVKILGILVSPILPKFFDELKAQLHLGHLDWKDINFNLVSHKIGKPNPLFKKVEIEEKKFPLNLRVGEILSAEPHPEADKLYILAVSLGDQRRQLVAGIREHYTKEELQGKKIIVVSNLRPAKLRGIESQGMLLAGEENGTVGVLTTDAPVGTSVTVEGFSNATDQIRYEDFEKVKLEVKGGVAFANNQELRAKGSQIIAERIKSGPVH